MQRNGCFTCPNNIWPDQSNWVFRNRITPMQVEPALLGLHNAFVCLDDLIVSNNSKHPIRMALLLEQLKNKQKLNT